MQADTRALLIDLDGVLRLWPKSDGDLEITHGLPAGAIRTVAFEPSLILKAITGQISDQEWRRRVQARLDRNHPEAQTSAAVAAWSTPRGMVNEPIRRLVQRVRERAKVVLITNATSRLNQDLESLGLLDQFDVVVNSSEVGVAKPESRIYFAALELAGAIASEALFVDDQLVNVQAASNLGIRAVHFVGYEALAATLADSGLLRKAA